MPLTRHHTGQWLYQFDRVIAGRRTRANRVLPKAWTRAQAQEYDRVESARLYALASGIQKAAEPLIDDAVVLYLQHHAPTLKNHVNLRQSLALLHGHYAGKPLSALGEVCRAYAADHATTLAPGTIRNRLAYLRSACRWAWRHHQLGEVDPGQRVVLPVVRNARQVFFDRATMLRIAAAMPNHTSRAALRVSFYSGMRLGEVLRAKAQRAGQGHVLTLADTKNGQPRQVPVHPRIAHLLRKPAPKPAAAPDRTGKRLTWPLAMHPSTVSHHVKQAMRATGMGHARLHDVRHSAASEMINAGVDLYTVGGVLGHKSATSTQRYAHLSAATLTAAVGKIGKKSQPPPTPTNPQARRYATD